MVTNNGFSTAISLNRYIGMVGTIPDRVNSECRDPEIIGKGDNSNTVFYTNKQFLIENTEVLTTSAGTTLTRTTDYSINYDDGVVTLETSGVTALGTDALWIEYKYNNESITNTEVVQALNAAESKVLRRTEQTFAEYTDDDPSYRKVVDEVFKGGETQSFTKRKVMEFWFQPLVEVATTVNGAYTTGGTTITLTDGAGLPNAATIYIGGNKVAYTARSTNDLTVPSTTPSIDDGVKVRGEVIEISREAEGNEPSYSVLDPDTEYKIDYIQGKVQLLENAFFGELNNNDVIFPANYLVRSSYFNAWHEKNENPTIPTDIEEVTNMIAAKKFTQRMVKKAHISGQNDFNPSALNAGDADVNEILEYYETLLVGTSPANKTDMS